MHGANDRGRFAFALPSPLRWELGRSLFKLRVTMSGDS